MPSIVVATKKFDLKAYQAQLAASKQSQYKQKNTKAVTYHKSKIIKSKPRQYIPKPQKRYANATQKVQTTGKKNTVFVNKSKVSLIPSFDIPEAHAMRSQNITPKEPGTGLFGSPSQISTQAQFTDYANAKPTQGVQHTVDLYEGNNPMNKEKPKPTTQRDLQADQDAKSIKNQADFDKIAGSVSSESVIESYQGSNTKLEQAKAKQAQIRAENKAYKETQQEKYKNFKSPKDDFDFGGLNSSYKSTTWNKQTKTVDKVSTNPYKGFSIDTNYTDKKSKQGKENTGLYANPMFDTKGMSPKKSGNPNPLY